MPAHAKQLSALWHCAAQPSAAKTHEYMLSNIFFPQAAFSCHVVAFSPLTKHVVVILVGFVAGSAACAGAIAASIAMITISFLIVVLPFGLNRRDVDCRGGSLSISWRKRRQ
jgi:hypothetical protein